MPVRPFVPAPAQPAFRFVTKHQSNHCITVGRLQERSDAVSAT